MRRDALARPGIGTTGAGWRRVGHEYHGPCPVSGAGRDCCFASEGRAGDVKLGCRRCGVRLDSEAFIAHVRALVGENARRVAER